VELREYIAMQLDGLKRGIDRVTKELNLEELKWRPTCGCNSIGLLLFHLAKSEDSFIQARLQGKPDLWDSEKWYEKLGMPQAEAGAHYTVDQVNAFPVRELKDIMAYYDAVREKTQAYLKKLTPQDLDKKYTMKPFGEMTVASIFSIIVTHTAQHLGEISYLRGLQRGMDK
jgi:uncharacterized damage-inducible protein DinB